MVCSMPLFGAVSYTPTNIEIKDSAAGTTTNLDPANWTDSSNTLTPAADLDMQGFTVGGTTYNQSLYTSVSGIETLDKNKVGWVIQPYDYASAHSNHDFYADTSVSTPNPLPDASTYLTAGENGLSFSTGLNLRNDRGFTFTVAMTFTQNPLNATGPLFIAGDNAKNQSLDTWDFLDDQRNVIASVQSQDPDESPTSGQAVWTKIANWDPERIATADGKNEGKFNGAREISFLAFSLGTTDFNSAAGYSSSDYGSITQLRITSPNNSPYDYAKTDWAFIATNNDYVLVPEVSLPLFPWMAGAAMMLFRRRPKKRA